MYQVKLVTKYMLNSRDLFVEYSLVNPTEMHFIPGQFINLNVAENTYRAYSIASPANEIIKLGFVISVDQPGIGANYLKNSQIGDQTKIIGPSGRFILPQNLFRDLVFVATGTGLAPYIPIFHKLVEQKYLGKIKLYFGARNETELFFIDKLDYFKQNLNLEYIICLSQPSAEWSQPMGRVTDLFDKNDVVNKQFFLCGHPAMIDDMQNVLLSSKVDKSNIFHEKFTVNKK